MSRIPVLMSMLISLPGGRLGAERRIAGGASAR